MTKMLFVEDRADLRAVIEDAFGEVGYVVAAVPAGRDVLASVGSFRPDLVIYDRDGLDCDAAADIDGTIRRLAQDNDQPVIVLGHRDASGIETRNGALCLSGPLDIDALIVAAVGLLSGELATSPAAIN